MNNISIEGQMDIFDYLKAQEVFCWDKDINYIHRTLKEIATHNGYKNGDAEFEVWSHAPQYGYRLTQRIIVHKGGNESFVREIDALIKEAERRSVELSPQWGAVCFFRAEEAGLLFFTRFLDGRRKIKGNKQE